MTAPLIPLALALAATLPAAALGWAVTRIAEPLLRTPGPRGLMGSAALAMIALAGLAAPLWPTPPHLVPIPLATATIPAATTKLNAIAAAPAWRFDVVPWIEGLAALVLAVAAFNLIWLAVRLMWASRLVSTAHPYADPAVETDLNRHAVRLDVIAPPLLVSDTATTAMLVGLRRPVILLPASLVAQTDALALGLICAHELVHLKRRDHWRALADGLVLAVVWFNPFAVDLARRQIAVREELCDQAVLADADPSERRRYAASLVEALRLAGSPSLHPSFIRRKGAGHAMRLQAVLRPASRPRAAAVVAAGGLVLLATLAGLGSSAALAQAAKGVTGADGDVAPPASAKPLYRVALKLFDGSKLIATPSLIVGEGSLAEFKTDGPAGLAVKVVIKPTDKDNLVVAINASAMKDGVMTFLGKPRLMIKKGSAASVEIAGKLHVLVSPVVAEAARNARVDVSSNSVDRDGLKESYVGNPTIHVEGQSAPVMTINNRAASASEINALDRSKITRIEMVHQPVSPTAPPTSGRIASLNVVAAGSNNTVAAMFYQPRPSTPGGKRVVQGSVVIGANTIQNPNGDHYVYTGDPSVKVTGVNPHVEVLIDGKPSNGAELKMDKSQIQRVEVEFKPTGEGVDPKVKVVNIITKPAA